MKRTLAILIALAMSVMMLTACGSKDGTSGTPDNSGDADQTSTGRVTPATRTSRSTAAIPPAAAPIPSAVCSRPRLARNSARPLPSRTSPALPVGSCGTR